MGTIQVLVVDDEAAFAGNLLRLLTTRGFAVQTAGNGSDAIRAAVTTPFDAVVLDVRMPGMDGIATLRELKKIRSDIEVIMLTGQADVETGIQAIREGAFDYLFKPCDIDHLTEKIREAVAADQIKRHPVLWPRRIVKEISNSNFVRLESGDDLQKAMDIFNTCRQTGIRDELHVIDGHDRLRGIVTKKDIIRAAEVTQTGRRIEWRSLSEHPEWLPRRPVSDIMQPPPPVHFHARPDERLTDLAERMIRHNRRCLPVMDEERLVGIIRFKDVIDHVSLMETGGDMSERAVTSDRNGESS